MTARDVDPAEIADIVEVDVDQAWRPRWKSLGGTGGMVAAEELGLFF